MSATTTMKCATSTIVKRRFNPLHEYGRSHDPNPFAGNANTLSRTGTLHIAKHAIHPLFVGVKEIKRRAGNSACSPALTVGSGSARIAEAKGLVKGQVSLVRNANWIIGRKREKPHVLHQGAKACKRNQHLGQLQAHPPCWRQVDMSEMTTLRSVGQVITSSR